VTGELRHQDGHLVLAATAIRPAVRVLPLRASDKLQWSHNTQTPKPLEASEAHAYQQLADELQISRSSHRVTVTGPLTQTRHGYELRVRVINMV
jgi:hypothetical protein